MSRSRFLRLASFIGDLDHSFYDDERQRDVWNEASAVGFQFMLWASLIGATLMIWIGKRPAIPYASALFFISGIGSVLAVSFAKSRAVEMNSPKNMNVRRGGAAGVVYLIGIVGILRANWPDAKDGFMGRSGSLIAGFLVGAAIAAAILAKNWKRIGTNLAEFKTAKDQGDLDRRKH